MPLFAVMAFAEISIKAEVDKLKISLDETIIYKLIVTSTEKNIPPPQLPDFQGLSVISQAQSSTVFFIKSDIKTILVYTYILAPKDKGKFKIEPSTTKIRNKTYSSEAFEIEVFQGAAEAQPEPKQKPSLPKRPQPESEEPQVSL